MKSNTPGVYVNGHYIHHRYLLSATSEDELNIAPDSFNQSDDILDIVGSSIEPIS